MGRGVAATVGTTLVAALTAACGGGGGDSPAPTSPAPPSSASSTGSAAPPVVASPSANPYVEVPDGVDLTAPGASLPLGESAVVAWMPRQGTVGVVDVTVRTIEETTVADAFAGYQVDRRTRRSAAYFVHAKVTNLGASDLGGRSLPLYALDTDGDLVGATAIGDGYRPCRRGVLPAAFANGTRTSACLVFLTPHGASLASVQFQPPPGVDPITWVGPTTPLKTSSGGKDRGGKPRRHR